MDSSQETDPFLWNEAQLIQEICKSNRAWGNIGQKFPDPNALASKLLENEVDGELLMTYEDNWGASLFLQECLQARLGIKSLRQQNAVKNFIRILKTKSPRYRIWKAEFDAQNREGLCEEENSSTCNSPPISGQVPQGLSSRHDGTPANSIVTPQPEILIGESNVTSHAPSPSITNEKTANDDQAQRPPLDLAEEQETILQNRSWTIRPLESLIKEQAASDHPHRRKYDEMSDSNVELGDRVLSEPPKKMKRIAPTTLTTAVTDAANSNLIPSEADGIMGASRLSSASTSKDDHSVDGTLAHFLHTSHPLQSYLGQATLDPEQIVRCDTHTIDDAREFAFLPSQVLPTGRRIQVHQSLKRFFRPGQMVVDRISSEDDILPLFGESDDELDEETIRQIEEDEAEDRRIAARHLAMEHSPLSGEAVDAVIQASVNLFEKAWELKKQPKLEFKAHKTWQDARRQNDRHIQINLAEDRIKHLDERFHKLVGQIVTEKWFNEAHVQRQCGVLEQTVHDRLYNRWLVKMLKNSTPPPKHASLPRTFQRTKKTYANLEEDEEVLSSDSDEYNFIDDSEQLPLIGDAKDHSEDDTCNPACSPTRSSLGSKQRSGSPRAGQPSSPEQKFEISRDKPLPVGTETPEPANECGDAIDITLSTPTSPAAADAETPAYNDIEGIRDLGLEYWERVGDPKRLIIAVLGSWGAERDDMFENIQRSESELLWEKCISRIQSHTMPDPGNPPSTPAAKRSSFAFRLARLFDAYISCSAQRLHKREFRDATIERMATAQSKFPEFHHFLRHIAPNFPSAKAPEPGSVLLTDSHHASDGLYDSSDDEDPTSNANKTSLLLEKIALDMGNELDEDILDTRSPGKKRRRRFQRDQAARNLRITTFERNAALDNRRRQLRERLEETGVVPGDKSRLIINEAKEDEHAFVYVNETIGKDIKDHQLDGVRFMWNQIVVDTQFQPGCLLAHTMGLGKTMQVITLLVAIAEASLSDDPAVFSQIPEHLRQPKTLILCPSGLVDNWEDELLKWAPQHLLGQPEKIITGSDVSPIYNWVDRGGVLIIGYTMFRNLVKDEALAKLLNQEPNLVVSDEAHTLKNTDSKISKATQDFRTTSRIAMTGSPLTNNVLDYYSMINWVTPNYLADLEEFRRVFANPIRDGLYSDSSPSQKRTALKLLRALKEQVAPKVHRMGSSTLRHELPNKKEFILSVPLTDVQKKAYQTYVREVVYNPQISGLLTGNSRVWSLVNNLRGLLAHPSVFRKWLMDRKMKKQDEVNDSEAHVELPEKFISDLLAIVNRRGIEDIQFSWKIVILLRILDVSKRAGDKVLIFSQSLSTLNFLQNLFNEKKLNYSRLDGNTGIKHRQSQVKNFNSESGAEVYLISTKAGGVGLNIFGANRVVIFDFKYTPAEEQQAVGRAYRIGQTKPVFVYWLIASGTYEEVIQNRSVFKMQLASRVVDKKNPIAWSKRLGDYFREPTTPKPQNLDGYFGQDKVLDSLLEDTTLQGAILQITSTDTFEEEEDEQLTQEEAQEAKTLVELHRLRLQDPEEYQRQERERMASLQSQILDRSTFGQVLGAGSSKSPAVENVEPTGLIKLLVPNPAGTPLPRIQQHSGVSNPFLPMSQPATTPIPGSPVDSSSFATMLRKAQVTGAAQTRPQNFGNFLSQPTISLEGTSAANRPAVGPFQPVLGVGTSYRQNAEHSVPGSQPSRTISTITEGSGQANERDKAAKLVESFDPGLAGLKRMGLPLTKDPKQLVDEISSTLHQQGRHTLDRREFIVHLKQTLQKSLRFAQAMLRGHFELDLLVSKTKQELLQLAAEWDFMDEKAFQETLKASCDQNSPSASTNISKSPTDRQIRTPNPGNDISAIEQTPEQRKSRVRDKLPWTSKKKRRKISTPQSNRVEPRPGDTFDSPQIID